MIDARLLRTDPDRIRRSQRARGESVELVDKLVGVDESRRQAIATYESARAEQKELGKQIPKAQGEEKQALLAKTKQLAEQVKSAEATQRETEAEFNELLLAVGNLVFDDVPEGGEDDYVVLETHGAPRDFESEGFAARDHLELSEGLGGVIDVERGAKVSGSRFYFLTGVAAELELALINLAMQTAIGNGFTAMVPPALVKPTAMEGTGFLGQAADDVYRLEADDLYLVGTAEVPLAAYRSEEILNAAELPLRYAGYSPSYRREAGSYGKDTRGIFRVHWFDKVEMFSYCDPEDAAAEHQRLLEWEKDFITKLELPFQVLELAAGDLGLSAARKYDCYAWFPSQGRYREITSTSNCTDFQARRLNIRARFGDGTRPVATLNGTLCAMTRMIIALLENHQQADGSIHVPQALRPYLGGRERLTAPGAVAR
ncbi:serine--tRNA ligase [Microlunatus soli]|uniref:Serine--tRNA ligase n=1 Tax=Microlunatus soli TaxID=630515 RepID=A0A1H1TKC5_9ACTN|nr:serine--tRNA ligase [Microlunatus soli]SDS59969.1 seryl-tRNA synthetase [Microlunatus soli]